MAQLPSVDDQFRAQRGVITRQQALAAGLSARQIQHRVTTGKWTSPYRSVYFHAAAPTSWHGHLLAAVLASGGVASHKCAVALWGFDVYRTPPVEITIEKGRWFRYEDVITHESTQWEFRDETIRNGIPCTGPQRSILDCANETSFQMTERIAEAAIRQRATTWLKLADCLSEHSRHGRNGCLPIRQLLQVRLDNRTVPLSDFSRRIVQLLERGNIPTPKVEYRIHDSEGGFIMQADLAWPNLRKAWELDGLQWHFGREDVERDRRKRNRAKAEGWTIQEILWSMYIDNPSELVRMADKFLKS